MTQTINQKHLQRKTVSNYVLSVKIFPLLTHSVLGRIFILILLIILSISYSRYTKQTNPEAKLTVTQTDRQTGRPVKQAYLAGN